MNDLAWKKVHELCSEYDRAFNVKAAYDVIVSAWRLGFDVVRAPSGSDLFLAYMQDKATNEAQAVEPWGSGGAAAQNMRR